MSMLANIITGFRVLCSMLLMFVPTFSVRFYIAYFLCGISDMIDGTVARKTNSDSEFGAKFDTIADFIFVIVVLIKCLPNMDISKWLWIWLGIIASIKIHTIVIGFAFEKKLVSLHTRMNKITGVLLFFLPVTQRLVELKYSVIVACFIATVSAIQERYILFLKKKIELRKNHF